MLQKEKQHNWDGIRDEEVWTAFLRSNKEAFTSIYNRFADELFSYGMHIHTNRNLIKDCIHDLFVDLWQQRHNLSTTDNIKFYLYRSLRRKIRHVIQRDKKLYNDTPSEFYTQVQAALPFEQLMINEQTHIDRLGKLSKAMEQLPSRQKEVVKLLYFDELTYEEVSDIMSINIRSVYTLLWKAISSLRKHVHVWLLIMLGTLQ